MVERPLCAQERKFNILYSAAGRWSAIVMTVEATAAQNNQNTFPALDAVSAGLKVRSGANGAFANHNCKVPSAIEYLII